jgi:hypothetical protein
MILEYKLTENDFFQMQLYFFNEEKLLKKVIIKNFFIWLIIYSVIFLIMFLNDQKETSYLVLIGAIIGLIIQPFMVKNLYFKRIQKQTKLYENRFNKIVSLEINKEYIKISGSVSESKINISTIDKIIETKEHFFMKFKPEVIIIPKSEIKDQTFVKNELTKLTEIQKIEFQNQLNWKW